jgi:hypothetical protein
VKTSKEWDFQRKSSQKIHPEFKYLAMNRVISPVSGRTHSSGFLDLAVYSSVKEKVVTTLW